MLFRISTRDGRIEQVSSKWTPKEIDLERYLLPRAEDDPVLNRSVFGEQLLLVSNQVKTRFRKRADILALDQFGSAVIIELKRDQGSLGVETQALQYLADFSFLKGERFLERFAGEGKDFESLVRGFLGGGFAIEDLNRHSRIILMARSFDPTLYSMGEWLSGVGVAFRCVSYTPVEIQGDRFLSFSVSFDRAPQTIYPLSFSPQSREPTCFWHNIGQPNDKWWAYLRETGQISAGFDNQPGDQGEKILKGYISGDTIVAYASGYGAIGWGVIEKPESYRLLKPGSGGIDLGESDRHRLRITWKTTAQRLADGIRPEEVRSRFGIYHPVSTSVRISPQAARELMKELDSRIRDS